jgi:uncharacterized membrane protein YcaP (DUF421 family)
MKPEEIKITDFMRIFVGDVPAVFYIEILIRVAVVYLILTVSMRLLGKRMASQLTRNELAALVSLAAAIGVPILAPDRGLLPAVVIAGIVVATSRLLTSLSSKNEKTEKVVQGEVDTLVKDAVLDQEAMIRIRVSKERIMAQLRSQKIFHLGEVQRLYMEGNGEFTLIKNDKPAPGLAVLPKTDEAFLKELKYNGVYVCENCGLHKEKNSKQNICKNCQNEKWTIAVEGLRT